MNHRRQVTMASILNSNSDELAMSLHRAGFLHLYTKLKSTYKDIPTPVLIDILHQISTSGIDRSHRYRRAAAQFLDPKDSTVELRIWRTPIYLGRKKSKKLNPNLDFEHRSSIHFSLEEAANKIDRYQKFDDVIERGINDLAGNHLAFTVKIHLTPPLLSS
ncbi:hypothetical protein L0F63_001966 [Massospora cicadina]|nr:hypothetical protein L0F63_001966 [Massospora cicadina]